MMIQTHAKAFKKIEGYTHPQFVGDESYDEKIKAIICDEKMQGIEVEINESQIITDNQISMSRSECESGAWNANIESDAGVTWATSVSMVFFFSPGNTTYQVYMDGDGCVGPMEPLSYGVPHYYVNFYSVTALRVVGGHPHQGIDPTQPINTIDPVTGECRLFGDACDTFVNTTLTTQAESCRPDLNYPLNWFNSQQAHTYLGMSGYDYFWRRTVDIHRIGCCTGSNTNHVVVAGGDLEHVALTNEESKALMLSWAPETLQVRHPATGKSKLYGNRIAQIIAQNGTFRVVYYPLS
jgi:hypothetical protein